MTEVTETPQKRGRKKMFRVRLWEWEWRGILNLLTEELDVWEKDSPKYREVQSTIGAIENQSGIRKRQALADNRELEAELRRDKGEKKS